eukprot:c39701_g1_i1 orf=79-825(+)
MAQQDVDMGDSDVSYVGISEQDLFKSAEAGNVSVFQSLSQDQLSKLSCLLNEDGRSLLHVAAAAGHEQIVSIFCQRLEASEVAMNSGDEEGWTPLHSAVSSGLWAVVEILLQAGADVSIANKGGRTALHYAASKGHVQIAQTLIEHGAKINSKDKVGCTPFHRAASAGHVGMCELLLEEGADVDATDKTGQTALMHATICNNKQIALLLIRHGANVDAQDYEQYTVLGRASEELLPALIDAAKMMLEG